VVDAGKRFQEAHPEEDDLTAWSEVHLAGHDADAAYDEYAAAWDQWQNSLGHSAVPDEPEAGA
jgi:hypothetical protein